MSKRLQMPKVVCLMMSGNAVLAMGTIKRDFVALNYAKVISEQKVCAIVDCLRGKIKDGCSSL